MTQPDRRRFVVAAVGAVAGAVAGVLAGPRAARASSRRTDPLRLALVAADPAGDAGLGARLGADEAARAASLFGGAAVELLVDADPERLLDAGARVLLGGADDADGERLSARVERDGGRALFLNVGATADALRGERCRAHTFHVAPSDAMRRAARAAAGESAAAGEVALWHESLTPFGAAQLNDRFRARFGRGMTSGAWAAWVAVKVAAEASLRTRRVDAPALAAYLTRAGVRFDGHKGRPLSFGASDHQLRQPLYLVRTDAAGRPHAEELPAADAAAATAASGCTRRDP